VVSLDIKKETSSALSPLHGAPPEQEEGEISFSALLKGAQEQDEKSNDPLIVLALESEETAKKPKLESFALDPKLSASMTQEELKVLIHKAKQFLKEKILQSDGFKKSEIATLPKTLSGLVASAKKIGIDITKITLEEVKSFHVAKGAQQKADLKEVIHGTKDIKEEPKIEQKSFQVTKEVQQERAPEDLGVGKKVKKQKLTATQQREHSDTTEERLEFGKKEPLLHKQQNSQEAKQTVLFKVQNSSVAITTQQIVETKVNNRTTQKTPKQKAEESLQLLLRGEKASKSDAMLSADFSVTTARVIAPQPVRETDNSLAALLKNESSDAIDLQAKRDGLQVAKAESFEVKINEAKQMVKYLSNDVKLAIEEYKSPFTRLKVQLHPQKLGEVDLTIVQRGKNLHINLSSNNSAINTLALNANDLKLQLNNNGIQNATLNFSNNAQSENSQAGEQERQRQQQQKAEDEYNYFENTQSDEEVFSSLEIIVPHYA